MWLAALGLLAGACAGGGEGRDGSTAETSVLPSSQDPGVVAVGWVDGLQARVIRTDGDRPGALTVELTNGTSSTVSVDPASVTASAAGDQPEPVGTGDAFDLAPGDDAALELRHDATSDAEIVISVPSPLLGVDPLRLRLDPAADVVPELPATHRVPVSGGAAADLHVDVHGVAYTESRIGVQVDLRNPSPGFRQIAGWEGTHLVDDLGNEHPLVPPPSSDGVIEVTGASTVSGVLSFAGRVHPDAGTLRLVVNADRSTTTGTVPRIALDPFAIGEDRRAGAQVPEPFDADLVATHPNGVQGRLGEVRFDATSVRAELHLVNPNDFDVFIQSSNVLVDSRLIDDRGVTHELLVDAATGFREVRVPATSEVDAELVFAGRLDPRARSFSIRLNEGTRDSAESTSAQAPMLVWDGLTVPAGRIDVGRELDPDSFVVPPASRLGAADLDRSSAEVVARTIEELDGDRTPDGIALVLPERVLFDFARADLRADARARLADVAGVLDHYTGARATITGHTDSVGSAASNQSLSEARAGAVRDAIVDLGIDSGRLEAVGRGESEPRVPNTTPDGGDDPAGRQQNRRVEIVVHTDEPLPDPG